MVAGLAGSVSHLLGCIDLGDDPNTEPPYMETRFSVTLKSIASSVKRCTSPTEALTAMVTLASFAARYGWIRSAIQAAGQAEYSRAASDLLFLAERVEHGATMAQCDRPHRRTEGRRRASQEKRAEHCRGMKSRKG